MLLGTAESSYFFPLVSDYPLPRNAALLGDSHKGGKLDLCGWILFHWLPISRQIIPREKIIGSHGITTYSFRSNLIDIPLKEQTCYTGRF